MLCNITDAVIWGPECDRFVVEREIAGAAGVWCDSSRRKKGDASGKERYDTRKWASFHLKVARIWLPCCANYYGDCLMKQGDGCDARNYASTYSCL